MKTLKITTDNKISIIDLNFDHESLREEVGGYVELVRTQKLLDYFKTKVVMIVDEEGGKTYLPRLKKRLYKGMNLEDGKDKELYKEYSPAMRDEAFRRGLEEYKREIEFNVGLAYGDLSDAQEVNKTATEVLASKTRKYNRVTAIQEKLEECLNGFVNALAFYNGSYMSGVEFTCEFNDSILADEESERQQDRQDVIFKFNTPFRSMICS